MWGGTQHDKTTHETEKDQRALLPDCLLHAGPADAVNTDYMLTVLHTAHKSHRSGSLGEMNEVSGLSMCQPWPTSKVPRRRPQEFPVHARECGFWPALLPNLAKKKGLSW